MNVYCVVYYPQIDTKVIDTMREKYDPYAQLIKPHITLVFPIPESEVDENELEQHIENVASSQSPIPIHMNKLTKSWDNWLFLETNDGEGKEELTRLHDEIYTGSLEKYLRKDIPYAPHIGLGLFNKPGSSYHVENPTQVEFDEERFLVAKREAEASGMDYNTIVDKVSLIKISLGEEGLSHIVSTKEFPLKAA